MLNAVKTQARNMYYLINDLIRLQQNIAICKLQRNIFGHRCNNTVSTADLEAKVMYSTELYTQRTF